MYLSGINNVSISLSLYCLVLFYMATEERLKPFSPFAKFLCIKAILFFSFWQACAFTVLLKVNPDFFGGGREAANLAQSLIICVEMVFAAIAQAFAFNYKPFMEAESSDISLQSRHLSSTHPSHHHSSHHHITSSSNNYSSSTSNSSSIKESQAL